MRIAGIVPESYVDGPGVRYALFMQGCPHHCKGCHNPETWDYNNGKHLTSEFVIEDIKLFFKRNPLLTGLTLSGGEPMEQAEELVEVLKEVKKLVKNVYCYTGYTFEELIAKNDDNINNLLQYIDYLVDGRFDIDKRCLHEMYKGSTNQRIIDIKKYLSQGVIEDVSIACEDTLF